MHLADAIEEWGIAHRTKMQDADIDVLRMVWSTIRRSDAAEFDVDDLSQDQSKAVMALFDKKHRRDVATVLNLVAQWTRSAARRDARRAGSAVAKPTVAAEEGPEATAPVVVSASQDAEASAPVVDSSTNTSPESVGSESKAESKKATNTGVKSSGDSEPQKRKSGNDAEGSSSGGAESSKHTTSKPATDTKSGTAVDSATEDVSDETGDAKDGPAGCGAEWLVDADDGESGSATDFDFEDDEVDDAAVDAADDLSGIDHGADVDEDEGIDVPADDAAAGRPDRTPDKDSAGRSRRSTGDVQPVATLEKPSRRFLAAWITLGVLTLISIGVLVYFLVIV